ncbi:MAG: sugar transferase [Anaerolineae bacterium]|nr:sugar transferase [Anaerolineae bacterium]
MVKRLMDVVGAMVGLVLFAPVMVIIAVLIKLDTPGPALYSAVRVGRHGQPFRMFKFRTMLVHADRLGPGLTRHADPRVTRLGRCLRRTRLDELPQFVNILRGEMSLIGPRPEAPEFVDLADPLWQRVLSVPPGMSGLAQVAYADEARLLTGPNVGHDYRAHILPGKLALDLTYVETQSVLLDLRLLFRTLSSLMRLSS